MNRSTASRPEPITGRERSTPAVPARPEVPAVMYGVAGGAGVLETDLVALSCLDRVSRVVSRTILSYLGE